MSATAAADPAQGAPSLDEIPAKPNHKIGQLTTGELARERSRLEAALRRPFAESVKALLRARLDAVLAEQAERQRRREAGRAVLARAQHNETSYFTELLDPLDLAGYLHIPEGRRDHTTPAETLCLHGLD
jgi:hypothetical protein